MCRLRFTFFDLADPSNPAGITHGRTPTLAINMSEQFQVFSAKKFPGVIESTALSKKFAAQGIKIPIRKDNKGEGREDIDDDE